MEVPCLNLEMSGRQKIAAHSAAKMGLRSGDSNQNGEGEDEACPSAEKTGNVADDIASIFAILKQISGELQSLKEIRKATTSMEGKLSALMDRISDVEGRLGFLEESDKKLQANPPARRDELEGLKEKLVDMEDRHRRNNLRFIGIPEGSEQDDMLSYLRKILSQLLGIASPPDGWDIERAHRALAPRPPSTERPRPVIARFMRSGVRDMVLRAAREKNQLLLGDRAIMVFPDYSRDTQLKRAAFRECKKALHDCHIKFALLFPATLRIDSAEGPKRFTDPKKAMEFIRSMQTV